MECEDGGEEGHPGPSHPGGCSFLGTNLKQQGVGAGALAQHGVLQSGEQEGVCRQGSGLRADGPGSHHPSLVSPLSPSRDPSAIQGRGALVWGASPPEYGDQGGLSVSGRLLGLKGAEPQSKVLRQ